MIYLLLKRHFEIFRVCQSRAVHPDELWDAADTMTWVLNAVNERVEALQCESTWLFSSSYSDCAL